MPPVSIDHTPDIPFLGETTFTNEAPYDFKVTRLAITKPASLLPNSSPAIQFIVEIHINFDPHVVICLLQRHTI